MVRNLFNNSKKFLPFIGILILIIIVLTLDVNKIIDAFLEIELIYILFALLLVIPMFLLRSYTWQYILREQKIELGYIRTMKIFMIGYFYCSVTPGYIGHLIRVPYVKEDTGEPYGKLFVNVVIDSTLRTLAQYLLVTIGAILVISTFPEIFWINITIFAVTIIILLYLIKKDRGEKLFHRIIKYTIPRKHKDKFFSFVDTFYHDFPKINRLIFPFLIGLSTWIIMFSQEYIIVMALDLPIPWHYFILLFPLANLSGFLPITFAGLGLRELTSITIFTTLFAVGAEEMLVATLVGFMITDVFAGLIGFFVSLTEAGNKKKASTMD